MTPGNPQYWKVDILLQDEPQLESLAPELEAAGLCLVRNHSYSWRIFHATDSEVVTSQLLGGSKHRCRRHLQGICGHPSLLPGSPSVTSS